MDDGKRDNTQFEKAMTRIIFIGEIKSSSEIHIHIPPTFYDAIQLSSNQSFIKEQKQPYQYLQLDPNKLLRFYYYDGTERKCGQIYLQKGTWKIQMEQPASTFCTHFILQKGDKLFFLFYPPKKGGSHCRKVPR
ncbi:hypothetical protein ACFSO7_22595 [Bacillus sp. CGMCC 1.16607]|uniref:hypothetical protein n=1 Tax=Bacillus sp. CGMCC 1.16607 TaxID=3351842 RepID=UPI00362E6013